MKKKIFIIVLLGILLFTGCDLTTEDPTALTPSTIVFADGATVSKQLGSGNYTNTITGDGTGFITYTSGTPATATVDSSTGEVTLLALGNTVITAVKAATTTHETVTNTYTFTVTALTPSSIIFADGATVSKQLGSGNYTNTVSGDGTGSITYTSGTPATATVDSSSGEVTILELGTTVITAVKAATGTYEAVTNTYTLTVVYLVGDIGPSGGWVFYDDEADGVDDIPHFRYLEAAPVDISETKKWGTKGKTVNGADGTAIGTGIQNTLDIIASDTDSTDNAAHACADYSVENDGITYDDWFLPSKDELNAMYDNLKVNSLDEFMSTYYWSSSESKNYNDRASEQNFYKGAQGDKVKEDDAYVRPVRAF